MALQTRPMLLAAALVTMACVAACSGDDDDTMMSSSGGGSTSSSSSGGGGASSSSGSATLSLYQRLGEEAGLKTFVDALVAEELKNADIASYFFFQSAGAGGGPVAGHPSVSQIKGCLVAQLGNAVGGPQSYPATVEGHLCRDMAAAHVSLGIPGGVFDQFIAIAAAQLQPLVVATPAAAGQISQAEFDTIAGFLVATKADVAQDTTRDAGPFNRQPDAGN